MPRPIRHPCASLIPLFRQELSISSCEHWRKSQKIVFIRRQKCYRHYVNVRKNSHEQAAAKGCHLVQRGRGKLLPPNAGSIHLDCSLWRGQRCFINYSSIATFVVSTFLGKYLCNAYKSAPNTRQ